MYNIALVEDEKDLNDLIKTYLEKEGYNVTSYYNGDTAIKDSNKDYHLWILDIMLGDDISGYDIIKKIREDNNDVPVIFTSARDKDLDKIIGLELGSDDYITKPFEAMELIARVNSNLRRYNQILALKENRNLNNNQQRLVVGGLELDKFTKEVFVNDRGVRLTAKEFQILELLMSYPGRVYSAEEIYEAVWKEEAINTETIMVHVRKLREKIEANPKKPEYLKVVWGIGYKIEKGV